MSAQLRVTSCTAMTRDGCTVWEVTETGGDWPTLLGWVIERAEGIGSVRAVDAARADISTVLWPRTGTEVTYGVLTDAAEWLATNAGFRVVEGDESTVEIAGRPI